MRFFAMLFTVILFLAFTGNSYGAEMTGVGDGDHVAQTGGGTSAGGVPGGHGVNGDQYQPQINNDMTGSIITGKNERGTAGPPHTGGRNA